MFFIIIEFSTYLNKADNIYNFNFNESLLR